MRSAALGLFSRSTLRVFAAGVALVLAATSCGFFGGERPTTTSTTATPSTTTTTIAFPARSTTSTTLAPGVDPETAATLQAQIADLLEDAERVRGLQFVEEPAVTILSGAEFAARLERELSAGGDRLVFGTDEGLYRMLGMLRPSADLDAILAALLDGSYVAFYDSAAFQIVVSSERGELTALDRSALFHELVHALTDQYFAVESTQADLVAAERTDEAVAHLALSEGDATYFQFVYMQGLDQPDQEAIARDATTARVPGGTPTWVLEDLAFAYDDGLEFVERLVEGGGIAAVDQAYLDPPISTEQVMHPERYRFGEAVRPVPPLAIDLDGYEVVHAGALGEWGLRILLNETLPAGVLTQTADGWGADAFVVLRSGPEVVFVYTYAADTDDDAIDVGLGLVQHAGGAMDAGDGIEVDGGILFDGGGPWVFVDRVGDGLVFIAATDAEAGREARTQIKVP